MKKILDTLRFVLISPEMLVAIIVFVILIYFPNISKFISTYIFNSQMQLNDYVKLLGIPITSVVLTYKFGESVLNPEDKINREKLKKWPNYWMLRNRIYFAIGISAFSAIGSFASWYIALGIDLLYGTALLLTFWSISLVSLSTVALAKLAIKDILY